MLRHNLICSMKNNFFAFLAYKYIIQELREYDSLTDDEVWNKCLEIEKEFLRWDAKRPSVPPSMYDSFMEFREFVSYDEDLI